MIQTVEKLRDVKVKVKLSVPLIASFLTKQYRQVDIAKACNVSEQAVSKYIKKHFDELAPLIDTTDGILAMQSKHLANKAQEKIEGILEVDSFNKKDLVPLNIVSGTHIDKYRLLSDKSTQNVSMATVDANIKELDQGIDEDEARLKKLTGEEEMGNQEVIEAECGE
jgi:predicted transcriptional regulator